jgi:hypothetical protein
MILCGCETYSFQTQEPETEDVELCSISFSLAFEKEVLPFPTTRAIPEDPNETISEPEVSDDATDGGNTTSPGIVDSTDGLFSTVEYVVYKKTIDEKYVYEKHRKRRKEGGYINLNDTLAPGEYRFYFFCHNSLANVSLESDILTFEDVSDSFFGKAEVELNMDTRLQTINVERVVSLVELISVDNVYNAYKKFQVNATNVANSFNLLDGKACAPDINYSYEEIYDFSESQLDNDKITYSFYTLVAEGNEISVTTSLLGDSEAVIKTVNIPNIVPAVNNIIRYTGSFFNPAAINNSFNLSVVNHTWNIVNGNLNVKQL